MPDPSDTTYPPRAYYSTPTTGDLIGSFRLLDLLGEGGMGYVFRAFDDNLRRQVALKVMKPDVARQAQARDLFLREARTAAAVRSDRIVTIYEAREAAGVPYIAMELLSGEPLDKYLEKNSIPPLSFALAVAFQVAEGLHAAHTHATPLIHRDVKPSNVWLRDTPGRAVDVRLLDFGLARAMNGDSLSDSDVAKLLGTPAYMSPEQWTGSGVDHRSDLFSLGVMLYQMTTGSRPFKGQTANEMMFDVCVSSTQPSRADLLNPAIPPKLAKLVADLIAREKMNRVQTASEVMKRLDEFLRPPTPMNVTIVDEVVPLRMATVPPPLPKPPKPPSQAVVTTPPRTNDLTRTITRPRSIQRAVMPWVVAVASVLMATAVWWFIFNNPNPIQPVPTRLRFQPPVVNPPVPEGDGSKDP